MLARYMRQAAERPVRYAARSDSHEAISRWLRAMLLRGTWTGDKKGGLAGLNNIVFPHPLDRSAVPDVHNLYQQILGGYHAQLPKLAGRARGNLNRAQAGNLDALLDMYHQMLGLSDDDPRIGAWLESGIIPEQGDAAALPEIHRQVEDLDHGGSRNEVGQLGAYLGAPRSRRNNLPPLGQDVLQQLPGLLGRATSHGHLEPLIQLVGHIRRHFGWEPTITAPVLGALQANVDTRDTLGRLTASATEPSISHHDEEGNALHTPEDYYTLQRRRR